MKRVFLKHTLALMALAVTTAAPSAYAQTKGPVGISMPTKASARWISDGDSMVKELKAKGYKTDRKSVV